MPPRFKTVPKEKLPEIAQTAIKAYERNKEAYPNHLQRPPLTMSFIVRDAPNASRNKGPSEPYTLPANKIVSVRKTENGEAKLELQMPATPPAKAATMRFPNEHLQYAYISLTVPPPPSEKDSPAEILHFRHEDSDPVDEMPELADCFTRAGTPVDADWPNLIDDEGPAGRITVGGDVTGELASSVLPRNTVMSVRRVDSPSAVPPDNEAAVPALPRPVARHAVPGRADRRPSQHMSFQDWRVQPAARSVSTDSNASGTNVASTFKSAFVPKSANDARPEQHEAVERVSDLAHATHALNGRVVFLEAENRRLRSEVDELREGFESLLTSVGQLAQKATALGTSDDELAGRCNNIAQAVTIQRERTEELRRFAVDAVSEINKINGDLYDDQGQSVLTVAGEHATSVRAELDDLRRQIDRLRQGRAVPTDGARTLPTRPQMSLSDAIRPAGAAANPANDPDPPRLTATVAEDALLFDVRTWPASGPEVARIWAALQDQCKFGPKNKTAWTKPSSDDVKKLLAHCDTIRERYESYGRDQPDWARLVPNLATDVNRMIAEHNFMLQKVFVDKDIDVKDALKKWDRDRLTDHTSSVPWQQFDPQVTKCLEESAGKRTFKSQIKDMMGEVAKATKQTKDATAKEAPKQSSPKKGKAAKDSDGD